MKKYLWILPLIVLSTQFSNGQAGTFNNPVIPGFNPDPSICRVGDDYYLATSTFEYFPGVPIYHSKDLVNWEMIGHALHRPEQLDLDNVADTAGIYAPTLRYYNGTYYMITTLIATERKNKKRGNFVVTAKNPEGPWSDPHWINGAEGIDPSLFFDEDGKVYYCGNGDPTNPDEKHDKYIWIQEIDLNTFQLKGERGYLSSKKYRENDIIGNAVAFEAPHIYKKNGIYYLLIAHGGTGMGHAVSIWKSTSPLGPWEDNPDNPILTHRGYSESGINCTGHADIIQTQDGDWWSVFLAVRSNDRKNNVMGRETFLSPVDWSGMWPIYNPKGKKGRTAFIHNPPKMFTKQKNNTDFTDEFESEQLDLAWNIIRTPRETWWDVKTQPGKARLLLRPDQIQQYAQPSFLGIRVPGMKIKASTLVDFTPKKPNECAGIAFERGHDAVWTLVKERVEDKLVVSAYEKETKLLGQVALETNKPISLKIKLVDFNMEFFVNQTGTSWQKVAETGIKELVGFPKSGRFTGSMIGLYASARGNSSTNWSTFENFNLQKIIKE